MLTDKSGIIKGIDRGLNAVALAGRASKRRLQHLAAANALCCGMLIVSFCFAMKLGWSGSFIVKHARLLSFIPLIPLSAVLTRFEPRQPCGTAVALEGVVSRSATPKQVTRSDSIEVECRIKSLPTRAVSIASR